MVRAQVSTWCSIKEEHLFERECEKSRPRDDLQSLMRSEKFGLELKLLLWLPP